MVRKQVFVTEVTGND